MSEETLLEQLFKCVEIYLNSKWERTTTKFKDGQEDVWSLGERSIIHSQNFRHFSASSAPTPRHIWRGSFLGATVTINYGVLPL